MAGWRKHIGRSTRSSMRSDNFGLQRSGAVSRVPVMVRQFTSELGNFESKSRPAFSQFADHFSKVKYRATALSDLPDRAASLMSREKNCSASADCPGPSRSLG